VSGVELFVDEGLGHSSYLVDLGDGTAAMVDPPRFPTDHLRAARARSLAPRWTIDTHSHADYVTGSPSLARDAGLTFVAPATSRLETPHLAVTDEQRIDVAAGIALRAIATPGHTPDHHVFLVERDGSPAALFTGGSLMVGAVGRTDLCGPELTEPLAHEMFHSLRRLDHLPDDLPVYPTHGAGSFCSAPGGSERVSTVGRERATNRLFRIDDEASFVEELLAGFGSFPTYFSQLPELNRRGPRLYAELPTLERLDLAAVDRHLDAGAAMIDARPIAEYGAGHLPGSISNALRPVFASWLGWMVPLDRSVILVAGADQDRRELVRQCLDIGHDNIVGEIEGGIDAWRGAARAITTIPLIGPAGIAPTLIDVRQRSEFDPGHIPGAIHIELGRLSTTPVAEGPVTVMCGHGERAMTGASILAARGHEQLSVLDGGPDTWTAWSGHPLVTER
jgi:glyoxylase-like metal-dependent hydrolase (beta-lactamase superfamily II)/rhodanese-related sulfurtransferase